MFTSVTQSCPTLCNPMDCSTLGFPVYHHLLEASQTHVYWVGDAIKPSHSLSSPSPPALNLSQHQGLTIASKRIKYLTINISGKRDLYSKTYKTILKILRNTHIMKRHSVSMIRRLNIDKMSILTKVIYSSIQSLSKF